MIKSATELLTAKEAAKRYAKHQNATGWCVDMSGKYPILLHSKSNRVSSLDELRYGFNAWAYANNIRIQGGGNYNDFLSTLPNRVIPLMVRVLGSSFKPSANEPYFADAYGVMLANTYFPYTPPAPANLNPPPIFLEMLERVFPLENERKWVVQYVASIINNPLQRPKHGLILSGTGAVGKSILVQLVKLALGGRHVNESCTFGGALEKFSEVYPNNLLVAFEDKTPGHDTYTNIKQIVDCATTSVSIKNQQRLVERGVYARTIITTNSRRIFKFDGNERRFFAPQYIEHHHSPTESKAFFKRFASEFLEHPDTPAFLYHWLLTYPMDGFEYGSCPVTPTMERMIGISDSVLTTMLTDYVADKPIFHSQQIVNYLIAQGINFPNIDEIKIKMNELGYEYKRLEIKSSPPIRPWVWKPISVGKCRSISSDEELAIRGVASQTF